jgi:hypothetical protein
VAAGRGRSRRVNIPGVAELLRPAVPLPATSDERQVTGRERHDQKITVYLSASELLELEHARLKLRRFGFVVDRGRLVREAIAILLADLDARGKDSVAARRILGGQSTDSELPGEHAGQQEPGQHQPRQDTDEGTGIPESTVPSLTWG